MRAVNFLFPVYPKLPPIVVSPYGVAVPLGITCAVGAVLLGFLFRERLAYALAGVRPWLLHAVLFAAVALGARLEKRYHPQAATSVTPIHRAADVFYWNQG